MINEKLSNEVKRYLERELKDYEENKKYIEELRLDIIESSPSSDLGMPKSPNRGNEQQTNKLSRLENSKVINRLEKITRSIYKVLEELDDNHYNLYVMHFQKGYNRTKTCYDMPISESTFNRYKNKILKDLAQKLGFL